MSKYTGAGGDEYQPGSDGRVLKNLLGIISVMEMHQVEYEALARTRHAYYNRIEDTTMLTVDLLIEMHRDWLGEIYPFAGTYRTVDITAPAQGDVPPFRFSHAAYIGTNLDNYAKSILSELTPCRAKSDLELAEKLARVHAEFIVIHPFREGNGRIGRWITELMALQAGFPAPDHGFASRHGSALRNEYYTAMRSALVHANYADLTKHFEGSLKRGERSFRS